MIMKAGKPGSHLFLSYGGSLGRLEYVGVSYEVGAMCSEVFLHEWKDHLNSYAVITSYRTLTK